jgi:hypothetical protein
MPPSSNCTNCSRTKHFDPLPAEHHSVKKIATTNLVIKLHADSASVMRIGSEEKNHWVRWWVFQGEVWVRQRCKQFCVLSDGDDIPSATGPIGLLDLLVWKHRSIVVFNV